MKNLLVAMWLLIAFQFPVEVCAETNDDLYMQAKRALNNNDWEQYYALKAQLENYPLRAYLEYYAILKNFSTIEPEKINHYINTYPQSPMAAKLRDKWLNHLIEQGQWQQFLKIYQPSDNVTMQCNYFQALQKTGTTSQEANVSIQKLWLTGQSLPDTCTPAFETWLSQNSDKANMLWQRFEIALKVYNFALAKYLVTNMNASQQHLANGILKLYDNPNLVTSKDFLSRYHSPEVISYGIARMARRSPDSAIQLWQRYSKQYQFSKADEQRIFQGIALKYALRKHSESTQWFRKVVGNKLDPVYQEWLVRAALYHNDWQLVKDSIEALPPEEQASDQWQYWYGRALEKLGVHEKSQQILTKLTNARSYYGFMASLYLKQPIKVKHQILDVSRAEDAEVEKMPAFQRAKLLYQLKHDQESRLELYYLIKNTNPKQQYIIMQKVLSWGWGTQALHLTRYAAYQDDVILRFPLNYYETVVQNANQRALNPALVYAIIRQESFFAPGVHSHAGAVGLMQLMPHTALTTSRQFNLTYGGTKDLLQGETNIKFGSAHLRKLYEQLANNPVLVIAAYNAGRDAVTRWLPNGKMIPTDVWIETVPFYETRNYIKNIIAYYCVYQYRLGQTPNIDFMIKAVTTP